MSNIEDRFERGLSADDEAFLKDLERDEGLFQQMGATFSGPLRYWTAFAFAFSFVFFALSVWAAYNMFQAEDLKHVIIWGVFFSWMSLAVGLMKVWFWMRVNQLNLLRELKRIELRLVKDGGSV